MTTITPHYIVVGNPTISSDYILSGTDTNNYLTFDGTLNINKSFDIIFCCLSRNDVDGSILQIGNGESVTTGLYIYMSGGRVYTRFGKSNSMVVSYIANDYLYYKLSYDSTSNINYLYYSVDGTDWTLSGQNSVTKPTISSSIKKIGYTSSNISGGIEGIPQFCNLLDLKTFIIINDGSILFKACDVSYDPVVTATEVFSLNKTFKGKKQITSLNCNNVQFVNNDMSFAFANCSNLTQVTNINQNTTNMAYAFAGCPTELYDTGFPQIPNSVQNITGLFAYHTDWTDIPVQAFVNAWSKVPAHLQTNVAGFLDGCTNLSNIPSNTLPNFMTNIAYAFRNCQAMTDMPIITENIVDMSEAFLGCSNLTNANYEIPNSVVNMRNTFYNCSNLTTAPNMANTTNVSDMFQTFAYSNLVETPDFTNCYNLSLLDHTFYYCKNLQNTSTIPTTITNMYYTFADCWNLVNAPVIPNSVTNMDGTFSCCYNLVNAPVIPNSVTNMYETFALCSNLVNAPVIPNSITSMGRTFASCRNLVNAPVIPNSVIDMSGTFSYCSNLVNVVIPNGVKKLNSTFSYCDGFIDTPSLPDSITDMNETFYYCNNLINALIPNSVINMYRTFWNCSNLVNVSNIPNTVVNMYGTFIRCSNLITVPVIPNSVIDMSGTFQSCYNLVNAPVIPNSVTNMSETFWYCSNLVNAPAIPNSVTNMYETFYGCMNLVNAPVIPNSVTNMYSTFYNCMNLVNASDIPNSVIDMSSTFYNCINLSATINVYSTEINKLTHFADNSKGVTLYIPITYQNGEYTKTYNSAVSSGYVLNGVYLNVLLRDINATYPQPDMREVDLSNYTYTIVEEFGGRIAKVNSYIGSETNVVIPDDYIW